MPSFSWCKHLSECCGGCCHLTPPKTRGAKPREGLGAGRAERLLKPPPVPAGLGEAAPPWELAAPAPQPRCPAHPAPAGPSQAGQRARAQEGAAGLQPARQVRTSLSARSGLQSCRRHLLSLFQRRGPGFPVLLAPHPPGFRHLPCWGQHPDAGLQELGQPGDLQGRWPRIHMSPHKSLLACTKMPSNALYPPRKPIQKSPILNQKFRIRSLNLRHQQGIALVPLICSS